MARLPLILLLSALAAATVRAQGGLPNLDILNNPGMLDAAQKCGEYFAQNSAGQDACASASEAAAAAGTWKCPEECKNFWASLPEACDALVSLGMAASGVGGPKDENGNPLTTREWYNRICSGQPVSIPTTPSGDNSTTGSPINYTGFASTFECDTAGGFSWVTLDPNLATLTGGGSAAAALNSTCNDLNTTGCCVEAPASNLTLAQFGLGKPMVVQGVKLTAPAGECCLDGSGGSGANCTEGSGPCTERFLRTYVSVSNSSLEQVLDSPDYKQWKDTIALANLTGDDLIFAGQSWLWSYLLAGANASAGLCNIVTEFDVYGTDNTDGSLINNGTVSIGCGLGVMGGKANVTASGSLAGLLGNTTGAGVGLAREKPQGSWLLLSRFSDEAPLAFCGLQVCAKAA